MSQKTKHIILGVTGSVAAYKSADLIRRFKEKGFAVSVILTDSAEKFITPLTLSSLSDGKVYRDLFDGNAQEGFMPHIDLARQADLLLVAPATANYIGKVANGLADDLLTCVTMATTAPIMIAPAMNTQMYNNPLVQNNITKLKEHGYVFIDPVEGDLACGEFGTGHIAEVDDIVRIVSDKL